MKTFKIRILPLVPIEAKMFQQNKIPGQQNLPKISNLSLDSHRQL